MWGCALDSSRLGWAQSREVVQEATNLLVSKTRPVFECQLLIFIVNYLLQLHVQTSNGHWFLVYLTSFFNSLASNGWLRWYLKRCGRKRSWFILRYYHLNVSLQVLRKSTKTSENGRPLAKIWSRYLHIIKDCLSSNRIAAPLADKYLFETGP
jgi:hypothetical protein